MPGFSRLFGLSSRSKEEESERKSTPSLKVDTTSTPRQTGAVEAPIENSPTSKARSPVASKARIPTVSFAVEPHPARTSAQPSGRKDGKGDGSEDGPSSSRPRKVRSLGEISTATAASGSTDASSSTRPTPIDSPTSDTSGSPQSPCSGRMSLPRNGSPSPPLWYFTEYHRWDGLIGKVLELTRGILRDHGFTYPFVSLCSTSADEALATEETMVLAIVLQPKDMKRYARAEQEVLRLCALYWGELGSPPVRFWQHSTQRRVRTPPMITRDGPRLTPKVSRAGEQDNDGSAGEGASSRAGIVKRSDAAGFLAVPT